MKRNRTVPKLLMQRNFLLRSVLYIFIFSILFMQIYQPFSETTWFGFSNRRSLNMTVMFYAVALITLIASKLLLCTSQKEKTYPVKTYMVWVASEYLLIALEYFGFTCLVTDITDLSDLLLIFARTLVCVLLILAIPYYTIALYAAYRDKVDELKLFKVTHRTVVPGNGNGRMLYLNDSFGKMKMSVQEDAVYYIESQDNYVKIYYLLDGKMSSYMLRCSTQKIEEYLVGTSIVRCRRSFLVNTSKIVKYKKKGKNTIITLASPSGKELTVTPANCAEIMSRIEGTVPVNPE